MATPEPRRRATIGVVPETQNASHAYAVGASTVGSLIGYGLVAVLGTVGSFFRGFDVFDILLIATGVALLATVQGLVKVIRPRLPSQRFIKLQLHISICSTYLNLQSVSSSFDQEHRESLLLSTQRSLLELQRKLEGLRIGSPAIPSNPDYEGWQDFLKGIEDCVEIGDLKHARRRWPLKGKEK